MDGGKQKDAVMLNIWEPYEAVRGLKKGQYLELMKIAGQDNPDQWAETAVVRGGVFFSKMKDRLICGVFDGQNVTDFKTFKQKLKLYYGKS